MNKKELEVFIYSIISRSPIGTLGRLFSQKTPRIILAYHGVHPNHPSCVHPDRFVQQVDYLKKHYHIVPVDEIVSNTVSSQKPMVAISFDDAYVSLIEYALPVLAASDIPAMIYAPVSYLGKHNEWDHAGSYPLMPIMSREEVKRVHSWGFSIGSHTMNHIRLRNIDEATLKKEIAESKRALEDIIGTQVASFAYPHGGRKDMDDNADNAVREAGYSTAVTTHFGRFNDWKNRFKLRRIIMWPSDSPDVFRMKLEGNFDWLGPKEDLIHRIKSMLGR